MFVIETMLRGDAALEQSGRPVLAVGDWIEYRCLEGRWALRTRDGAVLRDVPAPSQAYLQHLALGVVPVDEMSADVSIWLNGWRVGADVRIEAPDPEWLDGLDEVGIDADGRPLFRTTGIPANIVPVDPTDAPELLERKAASVRPTPGQLAWQQLELTAFIHFGMPTFLDAEGASGLEDPLLFDPTELDARQWARTLARAGFTMAILTTKHADGFLLWPTAHAEHSVAASPWKEGKGDVVREFVDAMREEGIRVGLYFSPLSKHEMRRVQSAIAPQHKRFGGSSDKPLTPDPEFGYPVDEYNGVYLRQLHELLTSYGPIEEIWLDGNDERYNEGPEDQIYLGRYWYDLARKLQPNVKFFNGWELRWVGNEDGLARDAEWSVLPITGELDGNLPHWTLDDATAPVLGGREQWRDASYLVWHPAEVDVSIRPGWFWHPDEQPKSVDELLEIYVRSVGRNANLLLNVPVDTRGLIPDEDAKRLAEFADRLGEAFGDTLAVSAPGATELVLDAEHPVRFVELAEDLGVGQRVEQFRVEVRTAGSWRAAAVGQTVGYKRIVDLGSPQAVDAVRVIVESARLEPRLASIKVFAARSEG